jgi:hypothetical protein
MDVLAPAGVRSPALAPAGKGAVLTLVMVSNEDGARVLKKIVLQIR